MEKSLDKRMDEVYQLPSVSGVICVDSSGLCLGGKGNIPQKYSGSISSLVSLAANLSQNPNTASPVVCIEAEHGWHPFSQEFPIAAPPPALTAI